jgi:beta-galactosidase
MYLGVDYYPEHWDVNFIDDDLTRMKEMGVNIIRIGEFAWHMMEEKEGVFDFSFFDMVITKAKEYGMKVMFGTPTATFPAWLANAHPDIFIEDEAGVKMAFGGRRQYCYNSKTYQFYSERIVEKLVQHYSGEEAIISWQIDNEFGHEGSDMCYCGSCHQEFIAYLENKYEDINELNEAWGTIFWGQTYNTFEEIPVPTKTITIHNPAMRLDWSRFRSYSLSRFANKHTNLVKQLKGDHQEVTTNLPGGFFGKWFDHNEFTDELDFVSYDNYPVWGGLVKPITPGHLSMTLDFVRGTKGQDFWIVEQLMGAQGHDVIGYLPRPKQAQLWAYHAFTYGCSNMLFFRWRGMNRGAEQNCLGIIDANNRKGRKYYEVKELFETVSAQKDILTAPVEAEVAFLYDFDNIWSWRVQQESSEFDYTNELLRLYEPFHANNAKIDVIRYDRDFSKYKTVVVPVPKLIDEKLAKRLEEYVADGGTLIVSFRAGVKDRQNNLEVGEVIPGKLSRLLGIEIFEAESLNKDQNVPVEAVSGGKQGECTVWRDLITPVTAEPLYKYADKFYSEYASITVNKFGKGKAYYVGAGVEPAVAEEVVALAAAEAGLTLRETEQGVECVEKKHDGTTYLLVMNHQDEARNFSGHQLQAFEYKLFVEKDGEIQVADEVMPG